ncbi:zinc-ribbon domain containing protein [Patescibacteria group bacterium]|nr:zinc-ribbon domain containing protein [Patescibacteria group bacterium]
MNTCKKCQSSFQITQGDHAYYDKIKVPAPTLCPPCREQRRLAFRNERQFYKRKCDLCNKDIISIYSPDKDHTVYCSDCWWSDNWDASKYARNYDFSRPFFDQFKELMETVPQIALMNLHNENSEYVNQCYGCKSCYMTIATDLSEDCYYADHCFNSKDCVESLGLHECQYCYECIDCIKCYQCYFSQDLTGCTDCWFSHSLRNCKNCFGCTNLRNKEYYIFNEPVSKEEWAQKMKSLQLTPQLVDQLKKQAKEKSLKYPHLYTIINNCEDCTGSYLTNCKNSHTCFESTGCEDCKYCTLIPETTKDSYDNSGGAGELLYESFSTGGPGQNCRFCGWCWNGVHNLTYCILCNNSSHDLFGCVGMRKKEYCILNKQYSQEEYEEIVEKIIEQMKEDGEWGEFFPGNISPFGYNETVAQEHYPLTAESAKKQDFPWSQYKTDTPNLPKKSAQEIPKTSDQITDDLLNYIFECKKTSRPFRFTKQELEFYKKHNLPLPFTHPDVRSSERLSQRPPRKLWKRECAKCSAPIETSYAPDRPEIVYCRECYLGEMY